MKSRLCAVAALGLALCGCRSATRPPVAASNPPATPTASSSKGPAGPEPAINREFVDLETGWRLRVIAAVNRSGSDRVGYVEVPSAGKGNGPGPITLKTTDDLIGYEDVIYAVVPATGRGRSGAGGVQLRLESANLVKAGVPEAIPQPTKGAVSVPRQGIHIRMVFLLRASDKDHEMAILSADKKEKLEPMLVALRSNPLVTCADRPKERTFCSWVRNGVAVRPEVQRTVDGVTRWVGRF